MITLKQEPAFISASQNTISIVFEEDDQHLTEFEYTTYVKVYRVASTNIALAGVSKDTPTLLKTLTKLSKARDCSYDLSNILQTQFTNWSPPFGHYILWKDYNSSFGYYVEYGEITYAANQVAVEVALGETDVKWCVRGALKSGETLEELTAFSDADVPAQPLNFVPAYSEQTRSNLIYYPFILPLPVGQESGYACTLYTNLTYLDGTVELAKAITTDELVEGGVYTYTLTPQQLTNQVDQLAHCELYIDWSALPGTTPAAPAAYTATATRSVTCAAGTVGSRSTRTATATSNISQADADQKAADAATAAATAALHCSTQYTSTQSYTASCASGTTGNDVTKSATQTSLVSQEDADAKALANARNAATAALQCTPAPTWSSAQEYTATCANTSKYGAGYYGNDTTRSATATSTVSQDDADQQAQAKAKQQAEADLVCEMQVWSCYYGGQNDNNQCFKNQMVDQFGNFRDCTYEEGQRCWMDDDGHGPGSCGVNPYQ